MKYFKKVDAIVEGVLDYLQSTKSLDLLPEVAKKLSQQSFVRVDPNLAIVSSSVKLTETQIQSIKQALSRYLSRSIKVKTKLDKTIIAGLRIEVAGQMIDGTVNQKLEDLKQKLIYD